MRPYGEALSEWMRDRGYDAPTLAREASLSVSLVRKLRRGHREPSPLAGMLLARLGAPRPTYVERDGRPVAVVE